MYNPTVNTGFLQGASAPQGATNNGLNLQLSTPTRNAGMQLSNPGTVVTQPYVQDAVGYGSSTSNPASPAIVQGVNDPNTLASYALGINQTNSALGRLTGQQSTGSNNIEQAYNTALAQLQASNADNQKAYTDSSHTNSQNYVNTKNTIGTNVGRQVNSLQRLLAAHGAGSSSASQFLAPELAARQGTAERSGAGTTFGQNQQGLDTNWANYQQDYGNDLGNLGVQKTNNLNKLQSGIDTTRANLLQSLAQLQSQQAAAQGGNASAAAQPYLNQANQYLTQADQLGAEVPQIAVQPHNFTAPSLQSYTLNPNAAPTANTNALTDSTSAFYNLLNPKNKTGSTVNVAGQ